MCISRIATFCNFLTFLSHNIGKSGTCSTTECWAYLKSTVLLLWHPWSCIPAFKYHPHTKSTYLYLTQRFRHFPSPMYPKHHFAPEPKTTPATVPGKYCLKSCKTVCNHLSKIDRRSTRIKTKFLRVGCVGVVGKGLYYHRFDDVLSRGNGMKWDDVLTRNQKCTCTQYNVYCIVQL